MKKERTIAIGGMSEGPDTLGRDRHRVLLNRLFAEYGNVNFGSAGLRPGFFLSEAGQFSHMHSDKPIEDKVVATRISKDGSAYAELGISIEVYRLDDSAYRYRLAELLIEGAAALTRKAAKKKLDFDGAKWEAIVREVIDQYLSAPLPLPATGAELEYVHKFLGVSEERGA